jgi:hypothetical protein
MLHHVFDTHEPAMTQADSFGDAPAFGQEIDDLGNAKNTQCHGDQRNAVEQVKLAEGITIDGIRGSGTDTAEQQAEAGCQAALERRAAGEKARERETEDAQHQQFGRAKEQHQRPRDGQG